MPAPTANAGKELNPLLAAFCAASAITASSFSRRKFGDCPWLSRTPNAASTRDHTRRPSVTYTRQLVVPISMQYKGSTGVILGGLPNQRDCGSVRAETPNQHQSKRMQ